MVTSRTSFGEHARLTINLPGRRYDHLFFSGMALFTLATVFVGFARTYYLAGLFHAPLPSPIVHVHGAVFSCWIIFLVVQTSLVAAGRLDVHRRIGIVGFILACLIVVLGIWVNNSALARGEGRPDGDGAFIFFLGVALILIFAVLTYFAFRFWSHPAAHKRLILIATIALLVPAIARLPLAFAPLLRWFHARRNIGRLITVRDGLQDFDFSCGQWFIQGFPQNKLINQSHVDVLPRSDLLWGKMCGN